MAYGTSLSSLPDSRPVFATQPETVLQFWLWPPPLVWREPDW
jgi:hypothetical protein